MSIAERPTKAPAAIQVRVNESALAQLEAIASECSLEAIAQAPRFLRAFRLAAGIRMLKAAITSDMMKDIMELQSTSLGFRTDKDQQNGYPEAVVKECLIECLLRGGYPVGNEFNIIAGRAYMTKEFFTRKVREFHGLTDLHQSPGVPQSGPNGALVPYIVTWRLNGLPCRLERIQTKQPDGSVIDNRIPVKVNQGMGVDAIIGKADRKALAAVYRELTGSTWTVPDGEADEGATLAAPSSLAQLTERLTGEANVVDAETPQSDEEQAGDARTRGPNSNKGQGQLLDTAPSAQEV